MTGALAVPVVTIMYLSRKSEHLDSEIVRGIHPIDTWVGHVSTGRFPAEDGVEHTLT